MERTTEELKTELARSRARNRRLAWTVAACTSLLALVVPAWVGGVAVPFTFADGDVALSLQVNQNFDTLTAEANRLADIVSGTQAEGNVIIQGVATPTANDHAVNRAYVDAAASGLGVSEITDVIATSGHNHHEAAQDCRNLTATCDFNLTTNNNTGCVSQSDWRLPSLEELALFIGNGDNTSIWTRTQDTNNPNQYFHMTLQNGQWGTSGGLNRGFRCVR